MRIIIFGGTGTLGNALSEHCRDLDVTIVSRCEIKQKKMRERFPTFRYVIGDICTDTWKAQLHGYYDYVFNLAAFKHVEIAEENVEQCINVNLMGTINTYDWFKDSCFRYIFSSTDKAVLPVNAYGMAKGLSCKYLYNMNEIYNNACVYAWGNVLASRGSVIHAFKESLLKTGRVNITDSRMTRFWTSIETVAKFMWDNKDELTFSEPLIPPMKASTVLALANATAHVLDTPCEVNYTGIRAGEKIHECLRTGHDYCLTSESCEQYTDKELTELVRGTL